MVTIYGVSCPELMFFESLGITLLAPTAESSITGVIKVMHGWMIEAQVVQQLRELAPSNFQWALVKLEDQVYKIDFP